MTENGAKPGEHREIAVRERRHHQHGRGAFQHVAEQSGGGQRLVAGAQHIGRTDIAGADAADVLHPREPREDHAEWDRAAEIAEQQGAGGGAKRRREDGVQHW